MPEQKRPKIRWKIPTPDTSWQMAEPFPTPKPGFPNPPRPSKPIFPKNVQPSTIFGCHFLYLKNQHRNATVISCKVYIISLIQVISANVQIWLINAWVIPRVDCMITQKRAPRRMKSRWKGRKQCLITKNLEWQKGQKTFIKEEYF